MLVELLMGKQGHPLSYKIRSLSTDQSYFEVLPANRYNQRIGLYQTTVGISTAEVLICFRLIIQLRTERKKK